MFCRHIVTMPPVISSQHNTYGAYEKKGISDVGRVFEGLERPESSEEDNEPVSHLRPAVDTRSGLSEIGFLVGTVLFVGGFIMFWSHVLLRSTVKKFDEDESSEPGGSLDGRRR